MGLHSLLNVSNPNEDHYKAKTILRCIAIPSSVLGIIFAGVGWPFAWPLFIPLIISLGWNIANIAWRASRSRPIHPGANVGVYLVCWIIFFSGMIYTLFAAGAWLTYVANALTLDSCNSEFENCYKKRYVTYDTGLKVNAAVAIVAGLIGLMMFVIHFVLFVFACMDVHRRGRVGDTYTNNYNQDNYKMEQGYNAQPQSGPNHPFS